MQTDPREPVKISPCGISCTICRFCIHGRCECQTGDGPRPFHQLTLQPCPVEQCATTRDITYCARDCADFPCLLLEHIVPYRWSRLATGSGSASLPPGQHQHGDQGDDVLRIVCLGEFRMFRGDVEVRGSDWGGGRGPTRKIKALLAFLLSRRAQGARKETLIDLLWSQQTDPKRANSSFHQALFCLRRALEPDLEAGTPSSYITRRGERYYFAPKKPCWIDVDAFVDCSERARSLENSGDPASAIESWARATELYGGRFMAAIDSKYTDSEYYDWCTTASYRFEQLFLAAALTVSRHHLHMGHYALAIVHAREALLVEPALEPAHQLLIRCLMETGQLEHALGQYRVCEAELEFHHESVPSEQTRVLYQELVERMGST